jgi:PKD repeat protein
MADVTAGPAPLAPHFMAMASDPDGDPLSYHWDFGNGTSSTEEDPSAAYTTPGSYTAVVEVSDGRGGTARGELAISVTGGDAPAVTVDATPASGAAPLDVLLTADAVDPQGGPLDYAWDLGDGSVAAGPQVEHTYLTDGVRVATVRVTDADGHVGTGTATVTVGDGAMLPDVAVTATPDDGTAPLRVAFSAEVTTTGGFAAFADGLSTYPGLTGRAGLTRARGLTRAWLDVTGLRPGASHLVHVHEQACASSNGGAHFRFDTSLPFGEANEIWLPFTADGEGHSERIEVTRPLRAGPAATSMVIHDPDNPAKRIGCVDLAPGTAGLTYAWDFGDGALGDGPDPDHVYAAPGTYSATLTVSGTHAGHEGGGDYVTRSVQVVVGAAADRTAPQTSIVGGATGVVRARSATFRLASDEPGVSYGCRLDGAAWRPCVSPVGLRGLRDGVHRLEVRARDRAGNGDPTSAVRTWTVDTRRPRVRIVRLSGSVGDRTPTIRARVRDAHLLGADGVVLRVDGRRVRVRVGHGRLTWTPRRSMTVGRHAVRLTVVDAAGNRTTVVRRFRIAR